MYFSLITFHLAILRLTQNKQVEMQRADTYLAVSGALYLPTAATTATTTTTTTTRGVKSNPTLYLTNSTDSCVKKKNTD